MKKITAKELAEILLKTPDAHIILEDSNGESSEYLNKNDISKSRNERENETIIHFSKYKDKKKKPFIIAIEGLDKAGKHTAAENLKKAIETELELSVEIVSFPRYETPTGQLIWDWLHNDPTQKNTSPQTFELLQATDKHLFSDQLQDETIKHPDIYILDRYIHTQIAYGQYQNDINWLLNLTDGIRIPDWVFYLDISPETSISRKGEHGENDRYESDIKLLEQLEENYKIAFKEKPTHKINIHAENEIKYVEEDLKRYIKYIQMALIEK